MDEEALAVPSAEPTELATRKFQDMFVEGVLPSGYSFELMPDTVGTAVAVASVDHTQIYMKKALQCLGVLKRCGDHVFHEQPAEKDALFINHMLDVDVMFISMAWAAQLEGLSLKMKDGVPCPGCGTKFMEIPFGDVEVYCRPRPLVGPAAVWDVKLEDKSSLPKSLLDGELKIMDPTWSGARRELSEKQWTNAEVVAIHRAAGALKYKGGSGPPRDVSKKAEFWNFRVKDIGAVVRAMDLVIPHFDNSLSLVCSGCSEISRIPFDQGL